MKQSTLIYFRNFSLFIGLACVLGLVPTFVILDNIFIPSSNGFIFIVNNLEMIIDPEIKRIVSSNNLSGLTDEQQIIEKIRIAQGEGETLANNLMSFFLVYVFGAFCFIILPIYLGVTISMKFSKRWFPIDMNRLKQAQQNNSSVK